MEDLLGDGGPPCLLVAGETIGICVDVIKGPSLKSGNTGSGGSTGGAAGFFFAGNDAATAADPAALLGGSFGITFEFSNGAV